MNLPIVNWEHILSEERLRRERARLNMKSKEEPNIVDCVLIKVVKYKALWSCGLMALNRDDLIYPIYSTSTVRRGGYRPDQIMSVIVHDERDPKNLRAICQMIDGPYIYMHFIMMENQLLQAKFYVSHNLEELITHKLKEKDLAALEIVRKKAWYDQ